MKLEALLKQKGIEFETHHHPRAYTAQELAHEEGVSGYMVAKPVVVKAGPRFVMCVLSAPRRIDLNRIGKLLHEEDVRLATEKELAEVCPRCELGAEPPVGTLFDMPTVMDRGLEDDDYLVMQAGTHTDAVKVRRSDWERLCQPIKADITLS